MIAVSRDIKVDQTIVDNIDGNCGAACLATIFGLSIEECPNLNYKNWEDDLSRWLESRGLWALTIMPTEDLFIYGFSMPAVKSKTIDGLHSVVFFDNKLYHDPNPLRDTYEPYTIDDVVEWTIFVARYP